MEQVPVGTKLFFSLGYFSLVFSLEMVVLKTVRSWEKSLRCKIEIWKLAEEKLQGSNVRFAQNIKRESKTKKATVKNGQKEPDQ